MREASINTIERIQPLVNMIALKQRAILLQLRDQLLKRAHFDHAVSSAGAAST